MVNNIKTSDLNLGEICEDLFLQSYKKYKKSKNKNAIIDFKHKHKKKLIELKARKYKFNSHLKDWQIGINKINKACEYYNNGYSIYFYMMFYDGLYFWKYNPNKVKTDLYLQLGGRVDRGRDEQKQYYYIKSDCMKPARHQIKVPEPIDIFEECLL